MRLRTKITSAGLILGLLSVFGGVAAAQQTAAQNPGPVAKSPGLTRPGEGRGFRRRLERRRGFGPGVLRELNLTDDQRQQIQAIVKQTFTGNKAAREELQQLGEKRRQGTLTDEEQSRAKTLHAQMRASMRDTETKLAGILTPEQKTRAEEIRKERRANPERFRDKRRGFPGRARHDNSPAPKPTQP